jgi:hypothetical protein
MIPDKTIPFVLTEEVVLPKEESSRLLQLKWKEMFDELEKEIVTEEGKAVLAAARKICPKEPRTDWDPESYGLKENSNVEEKKEEKGSSDMFEFYNQLEKEVLYHKTRSEELAKEVGSLQKLLEVTRGNVEDQRRELIDQKYEMTLMEKRAVEAEMHLENAWAAENAQSQVEGLIGKVRPTRQEQARVIVDLRTENSQLREQYANIDACRKNLINKRNQLQIKIRSHKEEWNTVYATLRDKTLKKKARIKAVLAMYEEE